MGTTSRRIKLLQLGTLIVLPFLAFPSARAEAPKALIRLTPLSTPADWKIEAAAPHYLDVKALKSATDAQKKLGHHINEKAPTQVEINGETFKPSHIDPRAATFTVRGEKGAAYSLSVFVCDDANTFCERQDLKGILEAPQATLPGPTP